MSKRLYRCKLDVDGTTTTLRRGLPAGAKLVFEQEAGEWFLRVKLKGKWVFQRADFDLINDADFEALFTLIVEESTDNGATWIEINWRGEFWKTDCEIDTDNKTITVEPRTQDGYSKILDGLEKEFNLIGLGPAAEQVKYLKQAVLQLHVNNTDVIMNYLAGTYWEENFDSASGTYNAVTLVNDYKFAFGYGSVYFIAGGGDLTPDVSGVYPYTGSAVLTRLDGAYTIQYEDLGSGSQWTIRQGDGSLAVVYKAPVGASLTNTGTGELTSINTGEALFTSETDPNSQCYVFYWPIYARFLTDELSLASVGLTTYPIPNPDISSGYGYENVAPFELNTFTVSDDHQADNQRYGQFADDALHFAGEFFTRLFPSATTGNRQPFPAYKTYWRQCSGWVWFDNQIDNIFAAAATEQTLRHAYPLHEVIKVLLNEIDDSITFDNTQAHSQFLYDASGNNPVSGDAQPALFITPKTNILTSQYDQPAKIAEIRLSDVLQMLWVVYRLKWYVDDQKRLRLEHVSWFENGGTYTGTNVGLDLTQLVEPKTGEKWSYRTSKWKYTKEQMPERILTKWMDRVSEPFVGFPIEMRSRFVDLGNFEEMRAGLFTSDLDFMQLQKNDIAKEGFALLAAFQDAGEWKVQLLHFEAPTGYNWSLQNGHLSFVYLHDKYHRHWLPASKVRINDRNETASSVKRARLQEFQIPMTNDPDTLQLVKTSLDGADKDGQVKEVEIDMESRTAKVKLLHDNE